MNKNIKRKKFNVSLLGESEVGKTRISNNYLGKDLDEFTLSTIGIESYMDTAEFDGTEYKFKIYDTAGQERYRSISKSTIKITDGFLLVFSVNNRKSFELINYWYDSIKDVIDIKRKVIILIAVPLLLESLYKNIMKNIRKSKKEKIVSSMMQITNILKNFGIDIKRKVIILIGNKIDLPNREVTNAEAVSFAKSKNIKYFETSAKTGFGIKEAFRELYQDIYDLFKSSKEKTENNIDLNEGNKDKKESKCC